jgi:hypothetical protein
MTKEYRDIDTLIKVSLFDLQSLETSISRGKKKKIITDAANSALGDFAYRWLEMGCWGVDPNTKEPFEDTVTVAPDCRLDNFHFIDIDNDGDLDVVYSSLVDQYVQSDTNEFILLQNNQGKYKKFGISGYLYDADFSKKSQGTIIFRTVSRPCCDYSYYNFSETTFSSKTWSLSKIHVLEIHKSKVQERY